MNIIFLDIDGVLKTPSTFNNDENELSGSMIYKINFDKKTFNLNESCVQYLKNVVEKTNCKIVISSSWRIKSCIKDFNKMFKLYDWDTEDIIIGFTPITTNGIRGEDIDEWFRNHYNIDVEKYIILDDCDDILIQQKIHLIQTNYQLGITNEIHEKIINYFKDNE